MCLLALVVAVSEEVSVCLTGGVDQMVSSGVKTGDSFRVCHLLLPHCSDPGWVSLTGFSSVPVLVLEFFCCPNCLYVKVVWLRLTSSQHRGIALLAALLMRQK